MLMHLEEKNIMTETVLQRAKGKQTDLTTT
jgi:hypothetical protein